MKLFTILFFISFLGHSQTPKCADLSSHIKENGLTTHVDSTFVGNGKYLDKIIFKTYENKHYALVKFVDNPKYYVYCDVPEENEKHFRNDDNAFEGKKFHVFIKPYQCDCLRK